MAKAGALSRVIVLCAVSALLAACEHKSPQNQKVRLLEPGDPDYPSLNPKPEHVVDFTAVVPPSLSSDFQLHFYVALPQDAIPPGCRWTQQSPFAVDVLLKLEKTGDTYQGRFYPDYFLPGPCGWHLDNISSPNYGTGLSEYRLPLLWFQSDPHALPGFSTAYLRLWCTRRAKPPQMPQLTGQLRCANFGAIRGLVEMPPDFVKSIPAEEYLPWSIHVTQALRSLTVEFHDLDSMVDAHERPRQP